MLTRSVRLIHLRIVFGLCLITAVIYFANVRTIYEHLADLAPAWLIVAVLCIIISSLVGAFNVYILIPKTDISWTAFLPIYWSAWSLNLVVPGQIGDIAGIAVLLRKYNIDWHTSIGKSLVDKFNSLFVSLLFGLAGILAIGIFPKVSKMDILLTVAVCLILLGLLASYAKHVTKNRNSLDRIRGFMLVTVGVIFETVRKNPVLTSLNLGLTFIKLGLTGFSYWCIFRAQHVIDLDILSVIFLASTSSLIAYIPISFNGIGTVEITGVYLFSEIGINTAAIITTYLVLRCTVLLIAWMPTSIWWSVTQHAKKPLR